MIYLGSKDCPGGSEVKNPPASTGDTGSIPGSGRCSGEGNGKPTPVFIAWEIPWTEESGGLQSMGLDMYWATKQLRFPDVFI